MYQSYFHAWVVTMQTLTIEGSVREGFVVIPLPYTMHILDVHQSNSSTCNTGCQTDISNKLKLGCYNFTINQVKHDEECVFIYLLFDCGSRVWCWFCTFLHVGAWAQFCTVPNMCVGLEVNLHKWDYIDKTHKSDKNQEWSQKRLQQITSLQPKIHTVIV